MLLKVISSGSKDGNCYILEHEGNRIMLDAGVPSNHIYKAIDYDISSLNGVLISHGHGDHAKAVPFLKKNWVDVYQAGESAVISGRFKGWKFTAFPVEHDEVAVGYFVSREDTPEHKIAYITDTAYCPYNPKGMTTLIIECNFINSLLINRMDEVARKRTERVYKNHMSLERVLSFLSKADTSDLRTVVLAHMSDANMDERMAVNMVREACGATVVASSRGLEISLDEIPF